MNVRSKLFAILPLLAFACCGPEQVASEEPDKHSEEPNRPSEEPNRPSEEPNRPSEEPNRPIAAAPGEPTTKAPEMVEDVNNNEPAATPKHEVATLGNGCFWCTEAVLEQLDGVIDVESGYTGGIVDNPTYEQICTGRTEHAEVVKVTFDPKVLSYEALLDWFFRSHDPTTRNRQGNDVGTQYRSAIFFHSKEQHQTALKFMEQIAGNWQDPIVTELTPAVKFWPAEQYHQDYFRNNQGQGYCQVIIAPKLKKLGLDATPKPNK